MTDTIHFQKSTLREKIVEHAFIGDALRELWRLRVVDVEILRSEFDAFGYDLVVEHRNITRHVQLKSGLNKPNNVGMAEALAHKASGCLIYIHISDGLSLDSFYWFGGPPGQKLPPIVDFNLLKRPRTQLERHNYRSLPYAAFKGPYSLREILEKLLGV